VTGLGAISLFGNYVDALWSNIKEGKSGIDYITRVDKDEFPVSVAAEVTEFDPSDYKEKKEARKMDLFAQYAVAASDMALKDSGLKITDANAEHVGVWIGIGL